MSFFTLKNMIFLGQFIVFLISIVQCSAQAQPNVLLIIVDDLGWNDVGYHGSEIQTPTIDRLVTSS